VHEVRTLQEWYRRKSGWVKKTDRQTGYGRIRIVTCNFLHISRMGTKIISCYAVINVGKLEVIFFSNLSLPENKVFFFVNLVILP
jgi:hypothetical protein